MADAFSLTPDERKALQPLKNWDIYRLSAGTASQLNHIQRRNDVVAIFASGDASTLKNFNGVSAAAAMDVIVREPNRKGNEPECNIYHYPFEPNGRGGLNQVGPFREATILSHWPKGKTAAEVIAEYENCSKGEV
jgi:hypothetical protein